MYDCERDFPGVYYNLARVLEINRDATLDVGLHLPTPPFRGVRIFDKHARCQERRQTVIIIGIDQRGNLSMSAKDLHALLGSRICHDLISPLSAIGNGVELLALSGVNAASEIALISESVENANLRIRFFRVAFGSARQDQQVAVSETRGLMADMSRGNRIAYTWTPTDDLPRLEVKLAFLLIQCLESAMAWGGEIAVDRQGTMWSVTGTAERLKLNHALRELLVDGSADVDISAADVHFALVTEAAQKAQKRLRTELSETRIRITF